MRATDDDIRGDLWPLRGYLAEVAPLLSTWMQVEQDGVATELVNGPPLSDDLPESEWEAVQRLEPLLFPEGWACRACPSTRYRTRRDRPRVRICRACRRSRSITAGTLLERQRDLVRFFHATHWLLERARATKAFARRYGCDPKTAYATFRRLRFALRRERPVLQEPLDAALVGRVAQPDQPEPQPPREHPTYGPVPAHLRPSVVWLDGRSALSFESEEASVRDVGGHLPEATSHPRHHFPPTRATLQMPPVRQLAHFVGVVIRRAHQRVSTRWLGRYLQALTWMATVRLQGWTRQQQLERLVELVLREAPREAVALRP